MGQKTAWDDAALTESDINTYLMGEGGAWTSWTPTVTQSGSVTVTNTRSRYARYGRTIHVSVYLTVTGSGTGSNAIVVSLPVTAASINGLVGIGSGLIIDSSSGYYYPCIVKNSSTTAIEFLDAAATGASWGIQGTATGSFAAALASGDVIAFAGTYEAAS